MALDNNDIEILLKKASQLWVFGYGSILWKTGFRYRSKRTGFVRGYARRFWQGNNSHRGTPEQPGRVATLIPDQASKVWGCAYKLKGKKMIRKALEHLGIRECLLGGYVIKMASFATSGSACCECRRAGCGCSRQCNCDRDCPCTCGVHIPVLLFMATPDNPQYLGEAPLDDLARQVVTSHGNNGSNVEYVSRLADYVRENIPQDTDEHLFDLDVKVRNILKQKNISLESLYSPHGEFHTSSSNQRHTCGEQGKLNERKPQTLLLQEVSSLYGNHGNNGNRGNHGNGEEKENDGLQTALDILLTL